MCKLYSLECANWVIELEWHLKYVTAMRIPMMQSNMMGYCSRSMFMGGKEMKDP